MDQTGKTQTPSTFELQQDRSKASKPNINTAGMEIYVLIIKYDVMLKEAIAAELREIILKLMDSSGG